MPLIVVLAGCSLLAGTPCQGGELPAVAIALDAAGRPEVTPLYDGPTSSKAAAPAIVVFAAESGEQWRPWPADDDSGPLAATVRGHAPAFADGGPGFAQPMVQLVGSLVTRGGAFLTPPAGGTCGNPRPTIRRATKAAGKATLVLRRGERVLARAEIDAARAVLRWEELPLVPALPTGLPPGEYVLSEEGAGVESSFTVLDAEAFAAVTQPADDLAALVPNKSDPLVLQVRVERLLAAHDAGGRPRPLLADALDALRPAATPHLVQLRDELQSRLAGAATTTAVADPTGVAAIDDARRLLFGGEWRQALVRLEAIDDRSERVQGLKSLYRATVLAEASADRHDDVRRTFLDAIERLERHPADAYRARLNYANYLLGQAQDRLYRRPIEAASGLKQSLLSALLDWREARLHLRAADALAEKLGPRPSLAVRANTARLYGVLADGLESLGDGQPTPALASLAKAADDEARRLARAAADAEAEPFVAAVAHETLAQRAFRAGDRKAALASADTARALFLAAGSLEGVEGIERLLAAAAMPAEEGDAANAAGGDRAAALRHLLTAQLLAEHLRGRVPPDRLGMSLAGFFARRAYVNAQLVELLLEDGKPREALVYAELAKARGLQDVLAARGCAAGAATTPPAEAVLDLLDAWPADVVAWEYFLGPRGVWLFRVEAGEVRAERLLDPAGNRLRSEVLVARVCRLLSQTEYQAAKMRRRLAAGEGFDHAWQDELHDFARVLLPGDALSRARRAKTVIVAPHHVLNYFPFAALVTARDERPLTPGQMAAPRMLVDEPFDLCHSPSLAGWSALRGREDRPIERAVAFGISHFASAADLPGTRQDLENLRAALGPRVKRVWTDDEAAEAVVKQTAAERGLLFFATHGHNIAERPLASNLVFRPRAGDDGYLTAAEIYRLDVAAELVVMSACYSGLGDASPPAGDDLFGLERAWLQSGARTVVAGLWDVYDGTGPELMKGFFQQLAAGQPAHRALAAAQREFLAARRRSAEAEPWLHPYFWAMYTVVGDDRTRMAR